MRAGYTTVAMPVAGWLAHYKPREGFAWIEPKEAADKTDGGLYLPDKAIAETSFGLVHSLTCEGDPGFVENDWVFFDRVSGKHYQFDDGILVLTRVEDVQCVLT